MHRIDTPTAQKDKFGAGKNGFTRGNPQTGVPATDLDDDYFDAIQEELAGLVEAGGLTLDKTDRGQVLKALKSLFSASSDSLGALAALTGAANKLLYFTGPKAASLADLTTFAREILAQTDAAGVLSKLGLGSLKYGAPMIGELIEWPIEQMPHEIWTDCGMKFIPYMAQTFDGTLYPLLAQLHPSLKLPADMRGQFVRGWDNGAGVDAGRTLMSNQGDAIRNIYGEFSSLVNTSSASTLSNLTGVFSAKDSSVLVPPNASGNGTANRPVTAKFDASTVVQTAADNRPMNISWNYIVRAS